jgi:hypothetical protein
MKFLDFCEEEAQQGWWTSWAPKPSFSKVIFPQQKEGLVTFCNYLYICLFDLKLKLSFPFICEINATKQWQYVIFNSNNAVIKCYRTPWSLRTDLYLSGEVLCAQHITHYLPSKSPHYNYFVPWIILTHSDSLSLYYYNTVFLYKPIPRPTRGPVVSTPS